MAEAETSLFSFRASIIEVEGSRKFEKLYFLDLFGPMMGMMGCCAETLSNLGQSKRLSTFFFFDLIMAL